MDQRRQPRVNYTCPAHLLYDDGQQAVAAQVRNLSASGAYLVAKHAPHAGTPVTCHLQLGDGARALRGKVAWVAPTSAPEQGQGLGIEFVDLSGPDARALSRITGQVRTVDDQQPEPASLSVRFEGLPQPIRTRGRWTGGTIEVSTALPFLRLGSQVEVRQDSGDGEPVGARIVGLSLGAVAAGEAPRIGITLAVDAAPAANLPPDPVPIARTSEQETQGYALFALERAARAAPRRRALRLALTIVAAAVPLLFILLRSQTRPPAPAPSVTLREPVAVAAAPVTPPAAVVPAVAEAPPPAAAAPARPAEPQRTRFRSFSMAAYPERTELDLPLSGAIDVRQELRLAPQPGVALILPGAALAAPAGRFRVGGPIVDRVTIEERRRGLYVRVLFGPKAGPYRIEPLSKGLRLVITHE